MTRERIDRAGALLVILMGLALLLVGLTCWVCSIEMVVVPADTCGAVF